MGRIFVTGDKHADCNAIRYAISKVENPQEDDFIIIAGDAGFEYEKHIMGRAKKEAKKFPGTWIVLRGNHDSCYWKHEGEEGWEVFQYLGCEYIRQKKYPNIWYLPDQGCIYRLNDYNILFIPGAYSVDKMYRLRNNFPWNPKEQLTDQERLDLESIVIQWITLGFDIDFVIGHTFPLKLQQYYDDLFLSGLDQSMVDQSMEKWLDNFSNVYENALNFKQYFGGHFHDDRILTDKYTMLYYNIVDLANYEKE